MILCANVLVLRDASCAGWPLAGRKEAACATDFQFSDIIVVVFLFLFFLFDLESPCNWQGSLHCGE